MPKKSNRCRIGIDLLGSDAPPKELLETILFALEEMDPAIHLTLFGTPSLFDALSPPSNVLFHPVQSTITMEDSPLTAIRRKRDSSLCVGIRMLKEGLLQAFISAGNTGALMGYAKIELPSLPGVERPALMTLLPRKLGEIAVLDVGANISCSAAHLVQFASMGIAYQKSRGLNMPRVGLLNIGSEAKKGTPQLRVAYEQLLALSQKKNASFIFSGNIEGRDVFNSLIDVLITDGFTGNVFLKTAEGIAMVLLEELQSPLAKTCPMPIQEMLSRMRQKIDYAEYPGAILCGVEGIILKYHGNFKAQSLIHSIAAAHRLVKHQFISQVNKELRKMHP